jgi:SAM-dependent methyltransferase
VSVGSALRPLTAREVERARSSRRHPRPTQFDYLHLRRLVLDIQRVLARSPGGVRDVLDIYCGSRPYDDLFPPGARVIGLDVEGNPYGVADVVSNEFLPFEDRSFDLVTCLEAFQYVEDPERGVDEISRVLRPGGTALLAVPFVWEYDRTILERRYTGPELAALFAAWEDVQVLEDGGRSVAWATLTGTLLERGRAQIPELGGLGRALRSLIPALYVLLNGFAYALDRIEERQAQGVTTLPMNLLLTARKPADD